MIVLPRLAVRRLGSALFVLLASLVLVGASSAQTTTIPRGATWKYEASGTPQPTSPGNDWRSPGFTDFTWSFGPTPIGYGEPYIATTVPYGPDSTQKRPTVYFRRAFSIGVNPATLQTVTLEVNYDNGFVMYLNGVELLRRSIAPGPIAYDSLALDHEGGNYEVIDLTSYTGMLVQGANFFAVEVHQADRASDDLVWDASLTYSNNATVTRGPYLQIGTPTSVGVRWRTSVATDSRVRYGTAVGSLTLSSSSPTMTSEHELTLTGLTPNTRYYYSVGTSGGTLGGGDSSYTFLTGPATPKPTRFWVIGDAGTGSGVQVAVRNAFYTYSAARDPDFWLMLGDNAYNDGNDSEYQTAVFDMYKTMLRKSVVWETRGNHDNLFASPVSDYYDIFTMPTAAEAGGLPSGSEAYYSFDYANMHIICLDSEGTDRTPAGTMLTWLQNDLAATDKDWIIAFWHHPPYTKGSHNSDDNNDSGARMKDMRQNALPILEAGGVDLVLCGHSHTYERSMLIDGHYGYSGTFAPTMKIDAGDGRVDGDGPYEKPHLGGAPHEGTVYTVAGSSGGQATGGTLNHPVMIRSSMETGSLVIDVNGLRLDSRFLDNQGVVTDSFTIVKGTLLGAPGPGRAAAGVELAPGRPNPFDTKTNIAYTLPHRGAVRLSIVDLGGRRVRTLVAGDQEAGPHAAIWDGRNDSGRDLGAGVYFSTLEFEGGRTARKLILVR